MKVLAPLAWAAALGVAAVLVVRARRGRPVVLRGRWSPRFVRMVAIAIVLLSGIGSRHAAAQEERPREGADAGLDAGPRTEPIVPAGGEFPADFGDRYAEWVSLCRADGGAWRAARRRAMGLPPEDGRGDGGGLVLPVPVDRFVTWWSEQPKAGDALDLSGVLEAAERAGIWDAWLAGAVWRSADRVRLDDFRARVDLYARVHRHLRVAHTLVRAEAITGPVYQRPWLSKAAPPAEYRRDRVEPEEFVKTARALYPLVGVETWGTEATLRLRVVEGSELALYRAGSRVVLPPNTVFDFGRLDVLRPEGGPAVLELHPLGRFDLAGSQWLTSYGVPEALTPDATARIGLWVADAIEGDRSLLPRIERALPACHVAIRKALAARPDASGAPSLRTVLTLFDE